MYYKEKRQQRKQRIADAIELLKSTMKCVKCPEAHTCCLDFHHRNRSTKTISISFAVRHAKSLNRILQEIALCDLLCANCHAKEHWPEIRGRLSPPITKFARAHLVKRQRVSCFIDKLKEVLACPCGENHKSCLDFHHIDQASKKFPIMHAMRYGYSLRRTMVEIEKCVVLCRNCHRKEHNGYNHYACK